MSTRALGLVASLEGGDGTYIVCHGDEHQLGHAISRYHTIRKKGRTKNEIATVSVYNPALTARVRRSGRPGAAVNRVLYIVGVPIGDGSRLPPRFGRLIRPSDGNPPSKGTGAYPSLSARRSVCLMYRSRRAYAMLMNAMAMHERTI